MIPPFDQYIQDNDYILMIPHHKNYQQVAALKDDAMEFCRIAGVSEEQVLYKHIKKLDKTVVYAKKAHCTETPHDCATTKNVFDYLTTTQTP